MRPLRHQRGLAAAAIVILIILGALALFLGRGAFDGRAGSDRGGDRLVLRVLRGLLRRDELNAVV